MNITIVSAESGDWSGVYYDGILKNEGHAVRHDELLDRLVEYGEPVESWEHSTVSDSFLEENGCRLPSELAAIPEDQLW